MDDKEIEKFFDKKISGRICVIEENTKIIYEALCEILSSIYAINYIDIIKEQITKKFS